jgi:hypothetical protein
MKLYPAGRHLSPRKRYDDAQEEYTKALDISPDDTGASRTASGYYSGANSIKTIKTAQQALIGCSRKPGSLS